MKSVVNDWRDYLQTIVFCCRALKSLERLQAQSADFPLVNGHSEDEPDPIVALDRIRGRYKVAISAIGPYAVGQSYKTDDLDRPVMNF